MKKIGERLVFQGKELSMYLVDIENRGKVVPDFEVVRFSNPLTKLVVSTHKHTFVPVEKGSKRILSRICIRSAVSRPVLELPSCKRG